MKYTILYINMVSHRVDTIFRDRDKEVQDFYLLAIYPYLYTVTMDYFGKIRVMTIKITIMDYDDENIES